MADWSTISSLATAGGTLVLAVATFASVRSANRAARVAERALLVGLRPLLVPSRPQDEDQKIRYADGRYVHVPGGLAIAEVVGDVIYLAISLRNVGSGIGVVHGWHVRWGPDFVGPPPGPENFRPQTRDLYLAPGGVGFWQAAIRDRADPEHEHLDSAVTSGELLTIDLLYGDHDGGQRTVSRFVLERRGDNSQWLTSVVRHWNLDRPNPRELDNPGHADRRDGEQ